MTYRPARIEILDDDAFTPRLFACARELFALLDDIELRSEACPLCGAYNAFEAHAETCRLAKWLTVVSDRDCFASKESRTEGRTES